MVMIAQSMNALELGHTTAAMDCAAQSAPAGGSSVLIAAGTRAVQPTTRRVWQALWCAG